MDEPIAIDGSSGPLSTRKIVVWRRLEPGDARTPGTELAPESEHLEAKVIEVGIAPSLLAELTALHDRRRELEQRAGSWVARYEPAGVLFATGGSFAVGAWLDYLPSIVLPYAGGLALAGVVFGASSRVQRTRRERAAHERWAQTDEHTALDALEATLRDRWERFAADLRAAGGFRTDVRVGDIHETERLVSIDPAKIGEPSTWAADRNPREVRYGWMYRDGRVIEQRAELEDEPSPAV